MADRPQTLLEIAKFALNGWACYAKTERELDEIGRLHTELKALADAPVSAPQVERRDVLTEAIAKLLNSIQEQDIELQTRGGNIHVQRGAMGYVKFYADRVAKAAEALRSAPAVSGEPPPVELTDAMVHQMWEEARQAYARSYGDAGAIGCRHHAANECGLAARAETVRSYLYQAGVIQPLPDARPVPAETKEQ